MYPTLIEVSDRIDSLVKADRKVRGGIANALQVSCFLTVEVDRSMKEAIRFWQGFLPVLSDLLDHDYREAKFFVRDVIRQGAIDVRSIGYDLQMAWNWIAPIVHALNVARLYLMVSIDMLVEHCEKTEEEVIADALDDMGEAAAASIKVFASAFCESFLVDPKPELDALTLRQLWQVAKGRVRGYRSMSKAQLLEALR